MMKVGRQPHRPRGEGAGFLASLAFTALASMRDVYFGGLFQSTSPLGVAIVAFTLCSLIFLPLALARSPQSFRVFRRHWRELFWTDVTTGLAWISFFYALRTIEPLLVQILFAGVGPLSVMWVDRIAGTTSPAPLGRAERPIYLGLLVSLVCATAVALGGLSGVGPQGFGTAALGVVLAAGAGISISVSTVLSRRLNDAGVAPTALVSVRFVGAIVLAAGLAWWSPVGGSSSSVTVAQGVSAMLTSGDGAIVLGATLALIVFPIYVNQVGVSLASPLTVRAAMALGPVLIFAFQLAEGRLSPSPYSLATGVLYGIFAVAAAVARRRNSRSAPGFPGRDEGPGGLGGPRLGPPFSQSVERSMSRVSRSLRTVRGWRNAEL